MSQSSPLTSKTSASVVARYWYCAEHGKLLFSGVRGKRTKAKSRGSRVHEWLESRPKSASEQKLLDRLKTLKPHFRVHQGTRVAVHPDDYEVSKRNLVAIEEFKTIHNYSSIRWFERFSLCCAVTQVKTYIWAMALPVTELGYRMNNRGTIYLYSHNGRFLKKYTVHFNVDAYLMELRDILAVYTGQRDTIPPSPIKCKHCEFREICPKMTAPLTKIKKFVIDHDTYLRDHDPLGEFRI